MQIQILKQTYKISLLVTFIIILKMLMPIIFAKENKEEKAVLAILNDKIFTQYDIDKRKKIYEIFNPQTKFSDAQILEHLILENLYLEFLSTKNLLMSQSDTQIILNELLNITKSKKYADTISEEELSEYAFNLALHTQVKNILWSNKSNAILDQSKEFLKEEQGIEVKFISFQTESKDKQSYENLKKLRHKISNLNKAQIMKLPQNLAQFKKNVKINFFNTNSLTLPMIEKTIIHDYKENSVSSVFLNDHNVFEFVLIYNKETYFDEKRKNTLTTELKTDRIMDSLKEFNQMLKNGAFIEIF